MFKVNPAHHGTDLLSIDINRGRDHGVPPYVKMLGMFKGSAVTTFDDLFPHISRRHIELLRSTYEAVEDIDLLVGVMLETPLWGTFLGRTAQMIAMKQFTLLKAADPYFYTKVLSNPTPFTPEQLSAIKKANTNSLFCLNTGVRWVPRTPLIAPESSADLVACDSLERISYESWRETPECVCPV